ncbi:putative nucleoside diphosphate kinase 5 [Vitis vinifera]|uniref:Nucleoside diphosphate kinase n=1 Tax=Vitis vinifera TaxID=29760 RepID=A0A438EWP6_VITVI|nr:putative nucleoside diphosphate kinase 5 [Vitis vinifera]
MIKPDGLSGNYADEIKNAILESGFIILREMTVRLDEDTAGKFYAEHSSRSFFPALVKYMTSGPVLVMVLEKINAVADWRALIGPTDAQKAKVTHPHSFFAGFLIVSALIFSIRAMCGQDLEKNCVHGSDSPQSAEREISFFFEEFSSGIYAFQGLSEFWGGMVPIVGVRSMTGSVVCIQCCVTMEVVPACLA